MRVPIGFVLRAHGIKGWVRVRTQGDALLGIREFFVGERAMKALHAQRERDDLLIQLEGVTDRTAAEALKGAPISIEREQLPPPAADELYVSDLVGCAVFDAAGKPLGEVVAVDYNGAHELLTVRGEREWQLPFVDGMVTSVDVAARRIVCDPPEGLVDL